MSAVPSSRSQPSPSRRLPFLADEALRSHRPALATRAIGHDGASTFEPAARRPFATWPAPTVLARAVERRPSDLPDRPCRNAPPPPADGPFGELRDEALEDAIQTYTTTGKQTLSYARAREVLFGELDVEAGKVRCVYTHREIRGGRIPSSNDLNVEHTWPQSKGATGAAKSDLHHLFPTDAKANSIRGNHPFGEVVNVKWSSTSGAKLGTDASGRTVFEPPEEHKGNVARALFYFSATYGRSIPASEEAVLKAWNREDPVDAREQQRDQRIFAHQHNRNPFVEDASLAERISDF